MASKGRRGDWVVAGGKVGESAHCTRCGAGLVLGSQPISVFVAASKAFAKMHAHCKPGWSEPLPRNLIEWAQGRDAGTSSLTIWSVATGMPSPHAHYDIPHDPQDFGRCYRLLQHFPELRATLPKVAEVHPQWQPFVDAWDELTAMYEKALETNEGEVMYNRMQQLSEREAKHGKV